MTAESAKYARLNAGRRPRVLELCSGAGGMALGFKSQGFELAAHMELSVEANATYAQNLLGLSPETGDPRTAPADMLTTSISDLRSRFSIAEADEDAFDVLLAGLPCQAFARVGRSKLRSVAGVDDAYKIDPRASLYVRFLEIIRETKPLVVVLENVPDILNFGGHNIPEDIATTLSTMGFSGSYSLLNAAFYGVPQFRERLFLVAYHRSIGSVPQLPAPTHYAKLPRGYESTRSVALKYVPASSSFFRAIQAPSDGLPPATTARAALADLPKIDFHLKASSPKRVSADLSRPYRAVRPSSYAEKMRNWAGFMSESADGHAIRLTPRDYETFGRMAPGDDYPRAVQCATALFEERVALNTLIEPDLIEALRLKIIPPYDPSKFPNKWWKMRADAPVRTLTAHMGKDTYSHIHFDSTQKRMVSVREAARLQSFPDGFRFGKSMNAALRQIGNAVPPLLAAAVAGEVMYGIFSGRHLPAAPSPKELL